MTRHRAILAVSTVVALLVAGIVAGITTVSAAGFVTATFTKDQDVDYQGEYTITNGTDAAITSWRVQFDLPADTQIDMFWDAVISRTGNQVTAVNESANGTIAVGASTGFGFTVIGSGTPANCTINGINCAGGTPPTASPPPTTTPPGGCTAPPWNAATVYTGGQQVSHNGHTWRAKWWTQGETPGVADVWHDLGLCDPATPPPTTAPPTSPPPTTAPPPPPGGKLLGYFVQWGIYQRGYHVKNIHTSGSAAQLTHINYAFANVANGQCVLGDTYADHDRFYGAGESVDGIADTWDAGSLRGNFGQLRKLKRMYPHLKILLSVGGWTWSGGFGQAAANPAAFADSCYRLVEDPRWADVFDGIDIDWEYPNACGLTCDSSGFASFPTMMSALRARFGGANLVTAAITADARNGGKIDAADYGGAAQYLDWYNVMTYDFFGGWAAQGPTAPHSPLSCYAGIPIQDFCSEAAIAKLKSKGVPSGKLLLGIGFYGRGWTGVTQSAPGGTATGPAPGTYEPGIEDYKVINSRCPVTGNVGGTAYAYCGNQWWSYDTPGTIGVKMNYQRQQGLGGAFFWELSGDTSGGELITAMRGGV